MTQSLLQKFVISLIWSIKHLDSEYNFCQIVHPCLLGGCFLKMFLKIFQLLLSTHMVGLDELWAGKKNVSCFQFCDEERWLEMGYGYIIF